MSRTLLAFHADDMSALAKALRKQLMERTGAPTHLEMLNMLARAIGHRNFQEFRAGAETPAAPDEARADAGIEPAETIAESRHHQEQVDRLVRCFDEAGRLLRWPSRRTDQVHALWVLWTRMPARQDLTERDISDRLKALNAFGDHAILRRELCSTGLMRRTPDGRVYRRVEQPLPYIVAEALKRIA